MATNIEQIFRSYVVTKFREIQEQQYGGGKVGGQQNGEINSSEQVSPSDDVIATIGNLQNDQLVQKIEQVLSEVLGAESQYKPDDGEETAKSKSRSAKRSLSDEVEMEVPRKKSKKDKKHKDKKKKKKRKKEKKYKKQSKESNDQDKESGDLQSVPDSKAENLISFMSPEDVDIGSASPLKPASEWFMEKNSYENLNSTMSNSRDAFSSDNSKLDTSEEDSVLINIQDLSEIKLTNEKENEQNTDVAIPPCVEDESLNTPVVESIVCMDRDEVASTKEIKQPETSLVSQAEEKVTVPDNSQESTGLEVEHLGTSLESGTVEVIDLNASRNLGSSRPETMQQSVPISIDKTDCKFMKLPSETVVEAKDSVTTLGFLAMVVGKDFEATSEFLNTAKVKASERSPKLDTFIIKDPASKRDSDKIVIGLEKNLQSDAKTEKKILEGTSESLYVVNFEPAQGHKHQPKVLKRVTEPDTLKYTEAALHAEADVRKLKETQTSAIMELKETASLMIDSGKPLSDRTAEVKNLEATSEFEEMNIRCLKAKSKCAPRPENWQTVPDSLRVADVRNLDSSSEFEREECYSETPLETVMKEREGYAVAKGTETVAKLKASESISRSRTGPEINDIKTNLEASDTLKKQYLEVSKYIGETDTESETLVKLKELEKIPESLLSVKNVESISETQYVKEIKHVDDVLQSDAVAQRKDSETSPVLEEERDSDAASESLHMIFTNYSEPNLELDAESEAMMELRTSKSIPELFPIVDANKSEELHVKEIKDLKTVESEAMIKLNDLEKKLKSLHRDVKSLEIPTVKCFKTLEVPEAMAKRKYNDTVSHSVTGIEKASDTIEYLEKEQNGDEAVGFRILPESQRMTENESPAKTESMLLISKTLEEKDAVNSETTPELGSMAAIQKLRDPVGFTVVLDIGSPKENVSEISASVDSQKPSPYEKTAIGFKSASECHVPFHPLKSKGTDVILDSVYGLEANSEVLFSVELGNLERKQKLKEQKETAGFTAASESLHASQRDLILVPESDEANKVVHSEHGSESSYMARTISENVLKSLYMTEVKDSKSPLQSKFLGEKDIEMESETTLRDGVEIVGNVPECESVVEILKITSDSPKKIEMPLELQCTSMLPISGAGLRSEALTFPDKESSSGVTCVTENLQVSSQREELEVMKTSEKVPTSLFGVMDSIATTSSDHAVEVRESKAIKTAAKNLQASTDSMDILKETFEPACITDIKGASQNLERSFDYLIKGAINKIYTESAHEVDASGSQTFQRGIPFIDPPISEVLTAADNRIKNNSETDLKPNTQSIVKYSESICQSEHVLERESSDTTVVLVEVRDSGASSSFLDKGETTPHPLCKFKSRDSETKTVGALNYSTLLEIQDPVASGTHLNTSELKSSESVCDVTDSKGILELKTAPTYLGAVEVFHSSGATSKTQSSGTEYVLDAATVSEAGMIKVSETMREAEDVEDLETVPKPKDAKEIKGTKYFPQSLSTGEVKNLEESVMLEEVLDVSETAQQFSSIAEVKDLDIVTPSAVSESTKNSEEQLKLQLHSKEKVSETLECTQISDAMVTYEDGKPGYSVMYTEPTTYSVDSKNSEATLEFIGAVDLKDTEPFVKSPHAVEPVHSKEVNDFKATLKSGSIGEINVLQVVQMATGKEEGLTVEGISKSTENLERHNLERNLPSVIVLEEKAPEVSLESSHAVKAKNSEVPLEYKSGKNVDVLEQNSNSIYMGQIRNLESTLEHDILKDSEAVLEVEEKELDGTPQVSLEEQILKATLKPVGSGAEDNLETNKISTELKDLETVVEPVCVAEKMNLEAGQLVTVEVKSSEASVHTAKEKDLEAAAEVSLKDKDSQSTLQSSDIKEQNESILKDKKSEKISSKSKDKSKSGKRAKKSRSKSTSKSKKRKKKSRSRSTSRRISSRRGRSRSRNDSDSRKKHSSSRHKSRSKSVDKKDSKESSLRSRRRRSRTADHPKSRSRSVEKVRSRWRRSRSSDHRKSRSRSVEKRESARRKRRLSQSSEKHKSRSKSVDRRETLTRSRRRRSRSSDHRKSRSQSVDKRDTSVRARRRRSRSSERSRSVDKRDTSARRRRRRSRTLDNCKSRSKSLDRRDSSIRSRRRRSRSSDRHKSRSRSVDDKRDSSLRTRRKRSRSLDNRKSRSRSVDKNTSIRTRRRRSRSSDNRRSRSKSVDKRDTSLRTRRKRSRSLDNRKSRSKSVDKRESSVRARRRRSRSSDNRKSRSRSADKCETSVRTRRKRSRSFDNRKSRSRSLDKGDTSVKTRRRRSRSSDLKSRSRSADKRETSVRTRRRRSRSLNNHRSRSKSVDKGETSVKTRQRRSKSLDNRKSRSKTPDKRDTSVRSKRRRSHSSDNRKSRSKSLDKKETSARSKRKRSRSCDSHKSRSKSVEKIETLTRSKRQRSQSSDQKSRTKSDEKEESSTVSRHRSKSLERQRSKSKSRSKSLERRQDKDSVDCLKEKRSKSRSKSLEKTEGTESVEVPESNRTKSPEHHKSKSRSRSKSPDKTKRERLHRSRSKGSKSPEPKTRRHRTISRSRRNRSRSLTRKRTSRSKSDHRSQSRSRTRSRSCSRRWRRTRSRSASRQRSLSRERRRRSRRNRSRSTERRRRRSDSRDSYRVSLRLRSRSRTPARLRCSRSTGRRRSTSKSPDHRRSRSSSRSPKRLTDLDKAQLLEIAKANAAAMCAKAGVPLPPSLMPVLAPEKKEEKVIQKTAKETIMELTEKCKKIAQSQEDDVIVNKPHVSDEEEEEHPFINHPFKLNEPKPIFFNLGTPSIKPAPPKNQVTLTKEFPVSSGSQHRKKEADSAYGEWVPVEKNKDENKDDVFPNPANLEPVDISSALNERTIAQKRLTENTFDLEAMCLLNRAQERIDAWAQLNSMPGQFTGSTGAQVLTSEQLSNSGPQAWIKKDQFLRAAPVSGGMGAQLMRKMGWREGEGLGKNKEGNKEPILVDFKTDRKGLVAVGEKTKRHGLFSAVKDLSGKHPVSLLVEACNKRRWSPPVFVLVHDNGPEHRKHFLFKVMVNGVEHKPINPSPNKKHAKAAAATMALQALGILPKELMANATSFRSASHI